MRRSATELLFPLWMLSLGAVGVFAHLLLS